MNENMLNKIINWAKHENAIRAVILTGSRGAQSTIDEFSDFDIALFVSDPKRYAAEDSWIKEIGKIDWKAAQAGGRNYYVRVFCVSHDVLLIRIILVDSILRI